jgi:hypothetical protein
VVKIRLPASASLGSDGKQIEALAARAQRGDAKALARLRPIFDASPAVWEACGDLAAQAESAWVEMIAGDQLLLDEAVRRKVANLREELGGPAPTPLERLLVERIAACWLQVQYFDVRYAQSAGELGIQWGEHYQRRQDRAQRRYLAAIRTLAQVRRLLTPVLQLNVGETQVNVVR